MGNLKENDYEIENKTRQIEDGVYEELIQLYEHRDAINKKEEP